MLRNIKQEYCTCSIEFISESARCTWVQGWEELMLVVESSMAGGRKEVALAAIAVITTVMQAHGTTKAVSRRYYCLWPSA